MKHIRKFNESIDVVYPMMDAVDFREKFSGKITRALVLTMNFEK
jgi:hypothetical protein